MRAFVGRLVTCPRWPGVWRVASAHVSGGRLRVSLSDGKRRVKAWADECFAYTARPGEKVPSLRA